MQDEWFVYIVECSDGTYYTGITKDVDERIRQHNHTKRAAAYTRSRRPVHLRHVEGPFDKSAALKRERFIKSLKRAQKEGLL